MCPLALQVMLFSTHKRESLFQACVHVVRLLLQLSKRQTLFSYVPEFYIDAPIEAFHALRRNGDYANLTSFSNGGLNDVLTFLVTHFADPRIIDPELRDLLLQSISMLLQYREFVAAFEDNEAAREHLIKNLLLTFDSRFWIPISTILLRLTKGRGFGQNTQKVELLGKHLKMHTANLLLEHVATSASVCDYLICRPIRCCRLWNFPALSSSGC